MCKADRAVHRVQCRDYSLPISTIILFEQQFVIWSDNQIFKWPLSNTSKKTLKEPQEKEA